MLKYRADIDGLRAVAIILVLLFHARTGILRGGFIGVDVFFVISGYLISSLLMDSLRAGEFTLIAFYDRRFRRILPALTFISLITAAFAALTLLPGDFVEFGKSLAATGLFVSNFFFMTVTGYFSTSTLEKPLLHTWSLGIEEQFYLFYPLLLLGLFKIFKGRHLSLILGVLASLSAGLLAIFRLCIALDRFLHPCLRAFLNWRLAGSSPP